MRFNFGPVQGRYRRGRADVAALALLDFERDGNAATVINGFSFDDPDTLDAFEFSQSLPCLLQMCRIIARAWRQGALPGDGLVAQLFGACHAYQGIPGLIVITVYGALFALLYIRTGRIWPCIIAHFFQDFSALFIPQ